MNNNIRTSPHAVRSDSPEEDRVRAFLAGATHYAATRIQEAPPSSPSASSDADSTDPCPLDAVTTTAREPLSQDAANAALSRVDGTQELSADDILEAADALPASLPTLDELPDTEDEIDVSMEEPVDAPPANHVAQVAPNHVAVAAFPAPRVNVPPPRLGAEDTWQALGRALGESQPTVMLDEPRRAARAPIASPVAPRPAYPPQRAYEVQPPARVAESIYPVEVPIQEAQTGLTGAFAAWPFRGSIPDASLSLHIQMRQPRALSTARWAVAAVTAFAAVLCLIAWSMSVGTHDDAAAAAASPPQSTSTLPQAVPTQATQIPATKQNVRADHAFANESAATTPTTSWTQNVMSGDAPGVSIDALPAAPKRGSIPTRNAPKRR